MPEEGEIRGVEKQETWIRIDTEFKLDGREGLLQRPAGIFKTRLLFFLCP